MAKTGRNEMRRSLSGEVSSRLDTISLTLAKPSAYAVGD
jgi:predicted DNA-binding protein